MDDEILDKTLVHIDSSFVDFQGQDKWIFNINLLEPLRDVVYIMILKTEITLIKNKKAQEPNEVFRINDVEFGTNTHGIEIYPIHVHINDFKRHSCVVSKNENEKHIAKYFEHIPVNINSALASTQNIATFGNQTFATFHRNNQNVHVLNPIEPNLQRLNFELRDKYDDPIDKSNISHFNMTLCIYQNSRRISRG